MADILILPDGQADLANIERYSFGNFADEVADEYMQGFRSSFARLAKYPESGPIFRGVKPEVRCLT